MRALILLVAFGSVLAPAVPDSYGYLTAVQQTLFATYATAQHISSTPAEYNRLLESTRTTFEAVTDALTKVKLTDRNAGAPLGSAADLVAAVAVMVQFRRPQPGPDRPLITFWDKRDNNTWKIQALGALSN